MTQKNTKVGLRKIRIKIIWVNPVWLEPSTSRTMTFGPVRRLRFIFLVLFILGEAWSYVAVRDAEVGKMPGKLWAERGAVIGLNLLNRKGKGILDLAGEG